MKLLDIISGQWAITAEVWREILAVYITHMKGEKIDIKGLEARVGMPFQSAKQAGYDVMNGKAVLNVTDVLTPELNLFSLIFGGTSTKQLVSDARAAMDDPSVNELIFRFNTPGGTVSGMFEATEAIKGMKGHKPMTGIAEGMVASAGYMLATAMDKLYVTSKAVQVGSIGTLYSHKDVSQALEQQGIKVTDISSGELKTMGSPYRPMTEGEKALLQADVNDVAQMFFEAVSASRGVSVEAVKGLQGGILRGQKAIEVGLVDGVSSMHDLLNGKTTSSKYTGGVRAEIKTKEEKAMTKEELMAAHPELYQAVLVEGKASVDMAAAKEEGAKAERERIQAVKAQCIPGHEALIEALASDGKTTGEQAAMKVLAAEKTLRETKAAAFAEDGKDVKVKDAAPGDDKAKTMKRKEFEAMTPADRREFLAQGGKLVD